MENCSDYGVSTLPPPDKLFESPYQLGHSHLQTDPLLPEVTDSLQRHGAPPTAAGAGHDAVAESASWAARWPGEWCALPEVGRVVRSATRFGH